MDSKAPDEALLRAWREGDMTAGDELFQRYYEPTLRFFRNKIDAAHIKDLVQQTFVGCVEGRERLRDAAGFRAYLFGVARNVLRNHLKARHAVPREDDLEAVSIADLAAGPKTLAAAREEHRLLLEGLRAIPVDAQIILELRYWERMETAEIADILAIPHGTARSRLRRAQQLLHQALGRLAASRKLLETTVSNLDDWARQCREQL